MLPRFGIRGKLFSSILLILLLSYSTLVYINVKSVYSSLDEDINQELETNLKYVQEQYLARADIIKYSVMQAAASKPFQEHLRAGDKVWLRNALQQCYDNLPVIDFLTVVDSESKVVARGFSDLSGDRLDPDGLVSGAIRRKQPLISTELVDNGVLCREGKTNYCSVPGKGEAMLVLVAVPIISPERGPVGAIITGDIINDAPISPSRSTR